MPNKDDGIPENGGGLDSLEQSISPFPTRKSIVSEAKANMLNAAADGMRADSGLRLEIAKRGEADFLSPKPMGYFPYNIVVAF
ncbi:MAG: hypothetical protein IPJ12_14370 [Betaproteobacteria bacterium]|nr:hypothetical protein [Betaproteobacteria bacterium]